MSKETISSEPDNEVYISENKRNLERKYLQLSGMQLNEGNIQQARYYAELAADLDTGNPDVFELLGSIFQSQKDYNKSIEYFTTAIKLSPEDCNLHFQRSNVYSEMHDYAAAKSDLNKAIELASIDSPLTRMYDGRAKELLKSDKVVDHYILQKVILETLERVYISRQESGEQTG